MKYTAIQILKDGDWVDISNHVSSVKVERLQEERGESAVVLDKAFWDFYMAVKNAIQFISAFQEAMPPELLKAIKRKEAKRRRYERMMARGAKRQRR